MSDARLEDFTAAKIQDLSGLGDLNFTTYSFVSHGRQQNVLIF
jgi:hypothetical protein